MNKITHESEVQRQHIRLPLPAQAEVAGTYYEISDLSSGGVGINDIGGNFSRGETLPIRIKLSFGSFALDLTIDSEVQHFDPATKQLGCRFKNLDSEQLSLLNHVIKAFMAGDIVAGNNLLNIALRDNFAKPRKTSDARAPKFSYLRQLPGLIGISAIAIIAVVFILTNIYQSLFTVTATSATITLGTQQIVALVDAKHAMRLKIGNISSITVAGSNKKFTGIVTKLKSSLTNEQSLVTGVFVYIEPNEDIPTALAGRPVHVSFSMR